MITKSTFEALSEKEKWDIFVAMRGPDCQFSETVKYYTTSVLRFWMSKVIRVGGLVNHDLKLILIPKWGIEKYSGTIPGWQKDHTSWNYDHFFEHVRSAAQALGVPELKIDAATWFDAMEKSEHYVHAGVKCYKSLSPEDQSSLLGKELHRHLERWLQ